MISSRIMSLIRQGIKSARPAAVSPMLCTLTKEPFDGDDWIFEVKWDGYRLISSTDKSSVVMVSRGGLDYTSRYPLIKQALKQLKHKAVLDGEVVVLNSKGMPDFDALQLYNGHNTPIYYCVFDLLWIDGYDLKDLPLITRKEILESVLKGNKVIQYSEHQSSGMELYKKMVAGGFEGIVAKKKESTYQPGKRGGDWLKVPTRIRQEFVIGGWAESDRGRSFRSLLFGAYKGEKLEWIGRSGGGYKEKDMPAILKKLEAIEIKFSPFINKVLDDKGAAIHWVRPTLVANFEFAAWTKSGRIRKPATFLGFRSDKKPADVVREVPKETAVDETVSQSPSRAAGTKSRKARYLNEDSNWKKVDEVKVRESDEIVVNGDTVTLTDVDREIWPAMPKARLIQYYHDIAPYILPHLQDRPQSLHIKQNGAMAPGFYIKDMENRQPEFAEIFSDTRKHKATGKRNQIDYLVCNNEATLLFMINLGCVDINPWTSTIRSIDTPDYINVDLDPSDGDFGKAIRTAQAAKEIFRNLKLASFVKTSGKTGIHLLIPCSGFTFSQARKISFRLCGLIHNRVPDITTLEIDINSRGNKLLIDYSQNDYADTLAAPYSVRPSHKPVVSTPLQWKEITARLDPAMFTIEKMLTRIKTKGDLFANLYDKKMKQQNAKQLMQLLEA